MRPSLRPSAASLCSEHIRCRHDGLLDVLSNLTCHELPELFHSEVLIGLPHIPEDCAHCRHPVRRPRDLAHQLAPPAELGHELLGVRAVLEAPQGQAAERAHRAPAQRLFALLGEIVHRAPEVRHVRRDLGEHGRVDVEQLFEGDLGRPPAVAVMEHHRHDRRETLGLGRRTVNASPISAPCRRGGETA